MNKKVKTMKVSGGDYAKVNARMLEFRKENPRGKITTEFDSILIEGGANYITFKATIVKDKADECSAEATGHARLPDDAKQKTFEKCETIAVGRALAFLGYGADGEIASSEEMEAFEEYRQVMFAEQLEEATENIRACKNANELKEVWSNLSPELKQALEGLKDEMKKSYESN